MRPLIAFFVSLAAAVVIAPALALSGPADPAGTTIEGLERQWGQAAKKADVEPLQSLLAEDFTLTNPVGQVVPKTIFVAKIKDGSFKIESIEYSDLKVRVYGDAAVVIGRLVLKGNWDGTDVSGDYAITDTFVKQAGKWREVAGQVTRVEG